MRSEQRGCHLAYMPAGTRMHTPVTITHTKAILWEYACMCSTVRTQYAAHIDLFAGAFAHNVVSNAFVYVMSGVSGG